MFRWFNERAERLAELHSLTKYEHYDKWVDKYNVLQVQIKTYQEQIEVLQYQLAAAKHDIVALQEQQIMLTTTTPGQ